MNFILVSPQFPNTYYKFAAALKANGWTVLGIGDTPYEQLSIEVKQNLVEYYYCPNMNDYGAMFKAVAFLSFKHGKIDWIESHNEWWLTTDARLRTDFNIQTGIGASDIIRYKAKSVMKEYFAKANVPCARFHLVQNLEGCQEFIKTVGYPVFVKPNIGVGSNFSFKINDEQELLRFLALPRPEPYIMEEFIDGLTVSYDGIANSNSEVVYEASNVFPMPNYIVVNTMSDDMYYTDPFVSDDLRTYGRAIIKAFAVRHRVFHLEFFRLNKDYPHLGPKGSLVALEVNMRPAGGYTPEMISMSKHLSLYQAWADVVTYNEVRQTSAELPVYVAAPARRNKTVYRHTHQEILSEYGPQIFRHDKYPPIISDGMGDYFYMAQFTTKEAVERFFIFVLEHAS